MTESGAESREAWARRLITTTSLEEKRRPGPIPARFDGRAAERITAPGRPPELRTVEKKKRVKATPGALARPEKRADLLHVFAHHELQAAELFAWAVLAFPETPEAFRTGLLSLALDELRHLDLYASHIETLGHPYGSFPVRDWFWERVPRVTTPLEFLVVLGLGLEGANLDHGTRFAALLEAAGDTEAAAIELRVRDEELAHVRFAFRWLRELGAETPLTFDAFRAYIPKPLSPILFRGTELERPLRERAGFAPEFLDALASYVMTPTP